MSAVVRLIAATLVGCVGVAILANGLVQRRPSLARMSAHLHRPADNLNVEHTFGQRLGDLLSRHVRLDSQSVADLALVRRPADVHAVYLMGATVVGLVGPFLVLTVLQAFGLISLGVAVPLLVGVGAAILSPAVLHLNMRHQALAIRSDLRYQLSAYLDVVTMLLAGNVGNEGALRQAAYTGDGRLFVELRRRIVIAETSSRSLVAALASLGDDLGLVELQQIAASASLGSSTGAPVAKSLAAKCATLRSALAAEQETDARVRTGKITLPLVGMSLLIMAAVMYPALNF